MVWMLARSEASPASQPGPGAHKSHSHRWGREVLRPGRATWRHSDGARTHSQMPSSAQHCGGPGSDATSPRGTRPGRVSVLPRLATGRVSRVARTHSPSLLAGVTRARPSLTNCRICPPFCQSENNVPSNGKPRPAETLEPALPPQLFTASHLQYLLY